MRFVNIERYLFTDRDRRRIHTRTKQKGVGVDIKQPCTRKSMLMTVANVATSFCFTACRGDDALGQKIK